MSESTENTQKWLDRIRALLAKAESTDFTEEAESYRAKAMTLIAQFGIDQALLHADDPAKNRMVAGNRVFQVHNPFGKDKASLLSRIVQTLGGRCVWLHKPEGRKQTWTELHVFATEADLARIDLLFTSLLVQCTTEMLRESKVNVDARWQPRKWKADFLYGFTSEIHDRLWNAEQRAKKQAQSERAAGKVSVELVLVDKSKLVDKAVEFFYPTLTKRTNKARELGIGYYNGRSAGARADLGDTRINTGAKKALVG
jgi:hypothetical protein